MHFRIKQILLITLLVLLLLPSSIVMSKYVSKIEQNGRTEIARPIIVFEEQTDLNSEIIDKDSFPLEYSFKIKNYIDDAINEVDFHYNIEIQGLEGNFPIKYILIDENIDEEMLLKESKTDNFQISKDIEEEKKYKLIIKWDKKDGTLDNELNLRIKVNVIQQKNNKKGEL